MRPPPIPLAPVRYRAPVPTRRACRALQETFLRLGEGRPLLLPRPEPLGDIDADELILAGGDEGGAGGLDFDLAPAIAPLRRQLLLTRAILAAGHNFGSRPLAIDQAARLAAELAQLLDQMATEQVGFEGLAGIAGDHAEHWQRTVNFLKILSEIWPTMLTLEGALDPAERRNRLLAAEAERLARHPPKAPLIAAGSTGSIPATAALLAVIAPASPGRVILPAWTARPMRRPGRPSRPIPSIPGMPWPCCCSASAWPRQEWRNGPSRASPPRRQAAAG
jgi:ATP-dependent helicase/nuclease subunit B